MRIVAVRAIFDALAGEYSRFDQSARLSERHVYSPVGKYLAPRASILDIGCGPGACATLIAGRARSKLEP
jgi:ubiquinone/menaquinone biosynthesis C-methylase UbiE